MLKTFFETLSGADSGNQNDVTKVTIFVVVAMAIGCVLSVLGAWAAVGTWSAGNIGLLVLVWAMASVAVGGIIGFLFGIPKIVQQDSDGAAEGYSQRVNTNLEQISDWLTKIIVGFGLIELRKAPFAFQSLVMFICKDTNVDPAVAGSILIYFAVIGFFAGYILTRLFLAAAFSRADTISNASAEALYREVNSDAGAPQMGFNLEVVEQIMSTSIEPIATVATQSRIAGGQQDALVIVDVQSEFFDGSLTVPNASTLVGPLNDAIKEAEQANMLIVFTQDWHPPDHSSFQTNGGIWPPHCVAGTSGAKLHSEIEIPESAVCVKFGVDPASDGYSPFENPRMDELINAPNIRRIYVVGIALEYCVLATCLDAVGRDKVVIPIKDLVRSVIPAKQEDIWGRMLQKGVSEPVEFETGMFQDGR